MSVTVQKLNMKVVSIASNERYLNSGIKAPLIIILKYLDTGYYENELYYVFITEKYKFFLIFALSGWLEVGKRNLSI